MQGLTVTTRDGVTRKEKKKMKTTEEICIESTQGKKVSSNPSSKAV